MHLNGCFYSIKLDGTSRGVLQMSVLSKEKAVG